MTFWTKIRNFVFFNKRVDGNEPVTLSANQPTNERQWVDVLAENVHVLEQLLKTSGPVRDAREIDFVCELPDEKAAIQARALLTEVFPKKVGRHLYALNKGDEFECKLIDKIEISAEHITKIELQMLQVCAPLGGTQVFWEFESTPHHS